jgi:hypothetical protein
MQEDMLMHTVEAIVTPDRFELGVHRMRVPGRPGVLRYLELFEMKARKDGRGHVMVWDPLSSTPRISQIIGYSPGRLLK